MRGTPGDVTFVQAFRGLRSFYALTSQLLRRTEPSSFRFNVIAKTKIQNILIQQPPSVHPTKARARTHPRPAPPNAAQMR